MKIYQKTCLFIFFIFTHSKVYTATPVKVWFRFKPIALPLIKYKGQDKVATEDAILSCKLRDWYDRFNWVSLNRAFYIKDAKINRHKPMFPGVLTIDIDLGCHLLDNVDTSSIPSCNTLDIGVYHFETHFYNYKDESDILNSAKDCLHLIDCMFEKDVLLYTKKREISLEYEADYSLKDLLDKDEKVCIECLAIIPRIEKQVSNNPPDASNTAIESLPKVVKEHPKLFIGVVGIVGIVIGYVVKSLLPRKKRNKK